MPLREAMLERNAAKAVQLGIEYATQPPFQAGRPEDAGSELAATISARLEAIRPAREAAIRAAAERLARSH